MLENALNYERLQDRAGGERLISRVGMVQMTTRGNFQRHTWGHVHLVSSDVRKAFRNMPLVGEQQKRSTGKISNKKVETCSRVRRQRKG